MDKLRFVSRYPYMIELQPSEYQGTIHLKTESIGLQLTCPEFPRTAGAALQVIKNNMSCWVPLANFSNVFELMANLEEKFKREATNSIDIEEYKTIFDELLTLGDTYSYVLSQDHRTVQFSNIVEYPDHYLQVVYDGHRQAFQMERHSLPDKCRYTLKGRNLLQIRREFQAKLENFEEFYNNLSNIDQLCFVVAPVPVTPKDSYRIFKFNEKVFLKVTLDPFLPSNVQLSFIGPIADVDALRRTYCEKIDDWDVDGNVHKNLLRMFDLPYFPYRPDRNSEMADNKPCNICFQFDFNKTFPIVTCFNPNCETVFHAICLTKWFETRDDTKIFCTVASGLCPYCKQKLTMYIDICEAIADT